MHWIYLGIAIFTEVIGSLSLKASAGFTKSSPAALALIAFGVSLYLLSKALTGIPLGIAYAVWAGAGISLVTIASVFVFKQSLDAPGVIGITLILSGIAIINVFSKASVN